MKLAGGQFTPRPRCPLFICNHFWQVPGGWVELRVVLGLN